jgi:hypothetical protein
MIVFVAMTVVVKIVGEGAVMIADDVRRYCCYSSEWTFERSGNIEMPIPVTWENRES